MPSSRHACHSDEHHRDPLFQNLVLLAWTLNDMPYALEIHPEPGKAETVCSFHVTPFIMSTAFNGALLLSCAVCAFLTRKLPDNYNESKFIAFCVYCTVVIQLAFIPAFFTVGNSVYETMFLTVSLWLSATLILFCIFVPKLYAVYFVKEDKLHIRNIFVRKNGVHRKSDVSYASDFPLPCSNRPRFSLSEVPLMSKMCRSVSQDTANGMDANDEIDKNMNAKESPNEVSNISVKPDEAAQSRQTSVGTLSKVPLEMVDEGSHPCAVSPGKSCAETIMGDTISVTQSAGSFSMFELDEKQWRAKKTLLRSHWKQRRRLSMRFRMDHVCRSSGLWTWSIGLNVEMRRGIHGAGWWTIIEWPK